MAPTEEQIEVEQLFIENYNRIKAQYEDAREDQVKTMKAGSFDTDEVNYAHAVDLHRTQIISEKGAAYSSLRMAKEIGHPYASEEAKEIYKKIGERGLIFYDIAVEAAYSAMAYAAIYTNRDLYVETRDEAARQSEANRLRLDMATANYNNATRLLGVLSGATPSITVSKDPAVIESVTKSVAEVFGVNLKDETAVASLRVRQAPQTVEFHADFAACDQDVFVEKMRSGAGLAGGAGMNLCEIGYGITTFNRNMNYFFGKSPVDALEPNDAGYLDMFGKIFLDGVSVAEACEDVTRGMASPREKANYMKCYLTSEALTREKAITLEIPGAVKDGPTVTVDMVSKIMREPAKSYLEASMMEDVFAELDAMQPPMPEEPELVGAMAEDPFTTLGVPLPGPSQIPLPPPGQVTLGRALESAMEEDTFAALDANRAPSASYNGMFSKGFAGGANDSAFKSAIDKNMGGALGGPKSDIHKNLATAMLELNGAINIKQDITMDNIFTVNGRVADAYKKAFDACEKALAEIERRKEAEKKAKEPAKPRELDGVSKEELDAIKAKAAGKQKLSKAETNALKASNNYDKALAGFEKHKASVDAKYAASLVSLGSQMTLMASNRGFIPMATQATFDRLRAGETLPAGYTFERMLGNVRIPVIDTGDSLGTDSGAINEVYRVAIDEKDLFIKPGKMNIDPNILADDENAISIAGQLTDIGVIEPNEREKIETFFTDKVTRIATGQDAASIPKPALGKARLGESAFRDQGMYILSKVLNIDSITPNRLGVDNKSGYVSVMDAAPGVRGDRVMVLHGENVESYRQVQQQMQESCKANGKPLRAIFQSEVVDAADPSLQVASMKLAVLDYIGGHFDRHPGNFFVSKGADGRFKITGIDNDSAFAPPGTGAATPKPENIIHVITPELQDMIRDIDVDNTVNALKGVIDRTPKGQKSLDAVRERITKLKEHVKDMVPVPEGSLNAETAKMMAVVPRLSHGAPLCEVIKFSSSAINSAKSELFFEASQKEAAAKQPEKEKAPEQSEKEKAPATKKEPEKAGAEKKDDTEMTASAKNRTRKG